MNDPTRHLSEALSETAHALRALNKRVTALELRDEQRAKAEAKPTRHIEECPACSSPPAESLVDRVVREQAGRWTLVSWERPLEDFGRACIRAFVERLDVTSMRLAANAVERRVYHTDTAAHFLVALRTIAGAKPAEREGAEHG